MSRKSEVGMKAWGVNRATYSLLCQNLDCESHSGVARSRCRLVYNDLISKLSGQSAKAGLLLAISSYINFNTALTAVLSCLWSELSRICGRRFTECVTKSGQTPLFGVTGLRASLLNCQKGTSVFWRMSDVCSATEQSAPCSRPRWQSLSRSK